MHRTLSLLFAVLFIFSAVLVPNASAMPAGEGEEAPASSDPYTPRGTLGYTPSSYYSSSSYYTYIRELKITGNQRLDLINAALTQVGYHEGNSFSQLGGGNSTGTHNYTEYGYWYGHYVLENNSGFFNEWCAMFTAWSARAAKISKSIINNAAYAHAGTNPFYFNVTYHPRGSYTPKPGDLIFYDWVGNGRSWDHVGIVAYIYNGRVHTVEGNASEMVLMRDVSLNDNEIQGYGVPKYSNASSSAVNVENYPVPTRTLEQGNTGNDVKWLQAALLRAGYPSPVDGSFGSNTRRLLKKFQTSVGLTSNGVCNSATLAKLRAAAANGPVNSTDPSNYPVPTRTLKKGMKGEDVKWLQAVLKKLGYSVTIDGDFGEQTKAKVKKAQGKYGLTQDGIVGPATRAKLIAAMNSSSGSGSGSGSGGSSQNPSDYPVPTRTLKKGMSGDDVKWLQATLKKLGGSISITGYFGNQTHSAVVAFQKKQGLTQDGIVGSGTRSKLIAALNSGSGSGSSQYPVPTRTLKLGCEGNDVKWLQQNLVRLGYTNSITGYFGTVTESNVKAFQRSNGLTADGKAGPQTISKIRSKLGI